MDLRGKLDQVRNEELRINVIENMFSVVQRFKEEILSAEIDDEDGLGQLDPNSVESLMAYIVRVANNAEECHCRKHALEQAVGICFGAAIVDLFEKGDFNEEQTELLARTMSHLYVSVDNMTMGGMIDMENKLRESIAMMKLQSLFGGGGGGGLVDALGGALAGALPPGVTVLAGSAEEGEDGKPDLSGMPPELRALFQEAIDRSNKETTEEPAETE